MTCRLDTQWSYRGLRCLRLENEHLVADMLPELGGKIFRLIDKRADRDVLWHSDRVAPHRAQLPADFDDHWSGVPDQQSCAAAASTKWPVHRGDDQESPRTSGRARCSVSRVGHRRKIDGPGATSPAWSGPARIQWSFKSLLRLSGATAQPSMPERQPKSTIR